MTPLNENLLRVKAAMSAAGREPDKPATPNRITSAQRNQAERWRMDKLLELDRAYAQGQSGDGPLITPEVLEQRKLDIENAFRRQIEPTVGERGTETVVTVEELKAVAARRGTTVDQERERAAAAGFAVR